LFSAGQRINQHPFTVHFLAGKSIFDSLKKYANLRGKIILQCGIGVSSRSFKIAVDRNRIKRLMRESYRHQKAALVAALEQKEIQLAIFLVYTAKDLPSLAFLNERMQLTLQKIVRSLPEE